MKIYRCCGYEEFYSYKAGKKYLKTFGSGTNTFNYEENSNYIHFFLFAESAYHYCKYSNNRFAKYFIECDIPFEILKKYYGFGWYEAVIPGYYAPILEFAIPYEKFNVDFICDMSESIKSKWFRAQKWRDYINNIPKEYLADYETGSFNLGYDEKSILKVPMECLIGQEFEINKKL